MHACVYIYIYIGVPRLALLLLPPYLSLRAQIYLCELISIFLIFSLCTCANLCLSAQIYVWGVGACSNLIFRVGACAISFFYLFARKFIFSIVAHALIYFCGLGTCANLFFYFFVLDQCCHMRKSMFAGAGTCAILIFRFGTVLSHAQIYF